MSDPRYDPRNKSPQRRRTCNLPARRLAAASGHSIVEQEWRLLTSIDFFYRRNI